MDNVIDLTEEQRQELINNLTEVFSTVVEAVEKLFNAVKKFFVELWENLKYIVEKSCKVQKYIRIYNRTHNQRIKKKQLKLIEKVLLE